MTHIKEAAFQYCQELIHVDIPSTSKLENIGKGSFSECKKLESITIPRLVTHIGREAFFNCDHLDEIMLSKEGVVCISEGNFHHHRITIPSPSIVVHGLNQSCRFVYDDDVLPPYYITNNDDNNTRLVIRLNQLCPQLIVVSKCLDYISPRQSMKTCIRIDESRASPTEWMLMTPKLRWEHTHERFQKIVTIFHGIETIEITSLLELARVKQTIGFLPPDTSREECFELAHHEMQPIVVNVLRFLC